MLILVKQAIQRAEAAAKAAGDEFLNSARFDSTGFVCDACGTAFIRTNESHTAVTRALKKLGIVGNKDGYYYSVNLHFDLGYPFGQSINLEQKAAEAAAKILTQELGQEFYVRTLMD